MEKLSDLINIGKEVERQLQQVGITNKDALESIGVKKPGLTFKVLILVHVSIV